LTLLGLQAVERRLGDIARILATICPTKPVEVIELLTVTMMQECKGDLITFLRNLLISMNQVAENDPDLNRMEQLFEDMNRRKQKLQEENFDSDGLAMEIAAFSIAKSIKTH
jgi:hypothetical protein